MIGQTCLVLCVIFASVEVSHQQVFTTELPASQTIEVGQTAYFQAEVASSITDDGEWFKDGASILPVANVRLIFTSGRTRQLIIPRVGSTDAGIYTLRIRGTNTSSVLIVGGAITITSVLSDQTVLVGDTATFQLVLSRSNVNAGQWYKDGALVVMNNRIQNFVTGTQQSLRILNVQTSDAGTYDYRINNLRTAAVLTVTVQQTISIVSFLSNQNVFVGETAFFQLTLSQNNVNTGQWYKDGAILSTNSRVQTQVTANVQSLRITNAQISDAGTYEYRINNLGTNAVLTVSVPQTISIVGFLSDQTVSVGGTALFQLTLSQNNVNTGQWYKNGVILATDTRVQTQVLNAVQSLRITNAQTSDAGTYEYRINNLRTSAVLTVIVPQVLRIDTGVQNVTVFVGSTATFTAALSQAGITTGTWSRNGVALTSNSKFQIITDGFFQRLNILNAQSSDVAFYNYAVSGLSSGAYLNVIGVLRMDSGFQNVTVFVGSDATFTATLSQAGITRGVWRSNGVVVSSNSKFQIVTDGLFQRLTIVNAQFSDMRFYSYVVDGLFTGAYLNVITGAVNGNWGAWFIVFDPPCGITCGSVFNVFRNRTRRCDSPVPSNGGLNCVGAANELQLKSCSFGSCPVVVNGNWGAWFTVFDPPCGITCGSVFNVFRNRTRLCNNPAPRNGGQNCVGAATEVVQKSCSFGNCPVVVNGNWGAWFTVFEPACGITCGSVFNVFRNRTRRCDSPVPSNGGLNCVGTSNELQLKSCSFGSCPVVVNGNWGAWFTVFDPPCGITCGSVFNVFRNRTRRCDSPVPSNGGLNCVGAANELQLKSCSFGSCLVNGNWGPWAAWSDPSCGITCGTRNDIVQRRSRLCNNPSTSIGGLTCNGSSEGTRPLICVFPACAVDLCSSAQIVNGVGYRYHPTDCDKYIQCYYNPNGYLIAAQRRCPFGFFWNQVTLRCDDAWRVNCPIERCRDNCTGHYSMQGSCRSYWECDRNRVSRPRCCAMGFSYVDRQGCEPNFFCRDMCPTACADRDVCDKHPFWSNADAYNISVGDAGWARASCPSGTFFDITECGCSAVNTSCQASYDLSFSAGTLVNPLATWLSLTGVSVSNDIASFSGSSELSADIKFPAATRGCPKIIRFRYRESSAVSGRRVLVSSSDCRRGNGLVIAVEGNTLMFELTSWYGWMVKMPIALTGILPGNWKTVTFKYSGYDMLAVIESGSLKYTAKIHATESSIMGCGLRFGTDGFNSEYNFIGDLDLLTLYRCNPGRLY